MIRLRAGNRDAEKGKPPILRSAQSQLRPRLASRTSRASISPSTRSRTVEPGRTPYHDQCHEQEYRAQTARTGASGDAVPGHPGRNRDRENLAVNRLGLTSNAPIPGGRRVDRFAIRPPNLDSASRAGNRGRERDRRTACDRRSLGLWLRLADVAPGLSIRRVPPGRASGFPSGPCASIPTSIAARRIARASCSASIVAGPVPVWLFRVAARETEAVIA